LLLRGLKYAYCFLYSEDYQADSMINTKPGEDEAVAEFLWKFLGLSSASTPSIIFNLADWHAFSSA